MEIKPIWVKSKIPICPGEGFYRKSSNGKILGFKNRIASTWTITLFYTRDRNQSHKNENQESGYEFFIHYLKIKV
jgi:hypothetical protein